MDVESSWNLSPQKIFYQKIWMLTIVYHETLAHSQVKTFKPSHRAWDILNIHTHNINEYACLRYRAMLAKDYCEYQNVCTFVSYEREPWNCEDPSPRCSNHIIMVFTFLD